MDKEMETAWNELANAAGSDCDSFMDAVLGVMRRGVELELPPHSEWARRVLDLEAKYEKLQHEAQYLRGRGQP